METPTPWMTREQAAGYLQVNVKTVDRWVREGRLRRHRFVGGHRGSRFHLADLDALLEPEVDPVEPVSLARS